MVKLDCDKFQFMLSGKPKFIEPLKNLTLMAEGNVIKQSVL